MSPIVLMALPVQQWQADASDGVGQVETPKQETEPAAGGLDAHMSNDDIFSQTFAELSSEEPILIEDPNAPPVETEVVEGVLPTAEQVAEAARQKAESNKEVKTPAVADQGKPIEQVLRELLGEREAKSKVVEPVVEQKPTYTVPDYTAEQKAIVDAYEAEFPEMAKAEQIIRSREYHAVTNFIYSQIQPIMTSQQNEIKRLNETISAMVGHQQSQHVEQTIGGSLQEMKPKIEAWIETQPDFIKPAYKAIAEKGTAAEVIGLVKAYQAANPTTEVKPAVQVPPGKEVAKVISQPVVVPQAKPKVPAGLRPVPTVRTTPNETHIPRDDFDGAFTAFSQQGTRVG